MAKKQASSKSKSTTYEGVKLNPNLNKGKLLPKELDPYIASDKLIDAVQWAQKLGMPLLLKGEPGCGKTRVAEAIAYELFEEDYASYLFKWHIKSTSKAQEGLYAIDYLKRLRDANLNDKQGDLDIYPGNYLSFGPLGEAFRKSRSMKAGQPGPVVLIDEIDKADIDFPNDLLLEIDQMKFTVPEAVAAKGSTTPLEVKANVNVKPIIIITSNAEKALPAAFLRRCIFHYIEFPNAQILEGIVQAKYGKMMAKVEGSSNEKDDVTADIVGYFNKVREQIKKQGGNKNVTTSELLNLVALHKLDFLKNVTYKLLKDKENLTLSDMRYAGVLLKDVDSMKYFVEAGAEQLNK